MWISRLRPVNRSNSTFQISILQKQLVITCYFKNHWIMATIISISTLINLIWVTNSFLIWCSSHLYFHNKPFRITLKPNSYKMPVFLRSFLNLTTPTFPNINFTKKVKNLLIVLKIIEKCCNIVYLLPIRFSIEVQDQVHTWCRFSKSPSKSVSSNFWQYHPDRNNYKFTCCLEIQSKWLKNLCLHPKFFKISLKPNSYLTLVSRRCPVSPSTLTFPNIILTQAIANLLFPWETIQKRLQ